MRIFTHGSIAKSDVRPPITHINYTVKNSGGTNSRTVTIDSPSQNTADLLVVCLNPNDYGIPPGWTQVPSAAALYYRMATSATSFTFGTPPDFKTRGAIMVAYRNTTGIVAATGYPSIIPQSSTSYVGIIAQNASNAATWTCMGAPGLTSYICTTAAGSGSQLLEVDVITAGVATAEPTDPGTGQKYVFELIRA